MIHYSSTAIQTTMSPKVIQLTDTSVMAVILCVQNKTEINTEGEEKRKTVFDCIIVFSPQVFSVYH